MTPPVSITTTTPQCRLQTIRYADDVSVGYAYGSDGRITQVTFTAPGITQGIAASGIVTQSNGLVRELTLGNGLKLLRSLTPAVNSPASNGVRTPRPIAMTQTAT